MLSKKCWLGPMLLRNVPVLLDSPLPSEECLSWQISQQRRMCFCLFNWQLTDCPTGLKDENIQTWERHQTKSSLPPIHSFLMAQRSTSCFSERWLPVHQHLGFKSRHPAKRRRKTDLTGFSFPLDEKQSRGRNRWRDTDIWGWGGVWPQIHACMLTSWEESPFCCPSTLGLQDFLWSSSLLWVVVVGSWKGEGGGGAGQGVVVMEE